MNKIKKFILTSKKLIPVLLSCTVICCGVLTSNVAYALGQERAETYSEQYLFDCAYYTYSRTYFEPTVDPLDAIKVASEVAKDNLEYGYSVAYEIYLATIEEK